MFKGVHERLTCDVIAYNKWFRNSRPIRHQNFMLYTYISNAHQSANNGGGTIWLDIATL